MKSNIVKHILFYIFFFGIIYFFGKTLYSNFSEIKNYDFEINFGYLFLSLVSFLVFFWSLGILWKGLLISPLLTSPHGRGIAQKIVNKDIHYINAISWISKYIPGKVAMVATKVLYLEKFGVSKKTSFLSCLYEHIFQIMSSFLLSLPFIIYYFWGTQNDIYVMLSSLSLIVGIIIIHPYIFNKVLNFALTLFKKTPLDASHFLSLSQILKYILGYSVSMILKGGSFVLFVASITQIGGIQDIVFYTFAWIFAGVIGIISIFAPNGLGVREGVLTLILTLVLPLEIAILISIGSRLWFSLCDGVIGIGILGVKYSKIKL
ncbi:hypothetical protein LR004_02100 [Candidatus Gracilibacteria bacterium]|nr:hypothetical protein [Candidatus Gracilibacteria bacterium]